MPSPLNFGPGNECLTPMIKAILIDKQDGAYGARLADVDETDLPDAPVTVRIEYSTVNYKDGLAITGKSPVVRKFPMVPGIDFAGIVESSTSAAWRPGDRVLLNGWGVGEVHWGGFAQKARVNAEWLQRVPDGFTTRQAMAIGTAGYTASLCVDALMRHGLTPGQGEVLVTGASGGVGSVAIALLAKAGFNVVASTGKASRSAISAGARRQTGHRPQRVVATGKAAAEGALGGGGRLRRQPHARERLRTDALPRPRGRLRPGAGHGFSDLGRTLHPARCVAARHRQRHGARRAARAGMESSGAGPRRIRARAHEPRDRSGRHLGRREGHRQRDDSRPRGRRRQPLIRINRRRGAVPPARATPPFSLYWTP